MRFRCGACVGWPQHLVSGQSSHPILSTCFLHIVLAQCVPCSSGHYHYYLFGHQLFIFPSVPHVFLVCILFSFGKACKENVLLCVVEGVLMSGGHRTAL